MLNKLLIIIGKLVILFSKLFNFGNGSTWPGHIALNANKKFIKEISLHNKNLKIILIAGTNGKTTTSKIIASIFECNGNKIFQNESGANLMNGIASALIKNSNLVARVKFDLGIFEVDENSLPLAIENLNPSLIIILNLFRDQLDRYGEIDAIIEKWKKALDKIDKKTVLVLNADDPKIAYLGNTGKNVKYFGAQGKNLKYDHASDSIYCPRCESKLTYPNKTFSHLGDWSCPNCKLKKPLSNIDSYKFYPLPGLYNKYNTHAAILAAKSFGVPEKIIFRALRNFKPAFGRQEQLQIKDRNIKIFLSKNPVSFNQSLETIIELKAKHILIIINDRIPDGQDISWIWDVDFEKLKDKFSSIYVSGDRVYEMALRLKYAEIKKINVYEKINDALKYQLSNLPEHETLYVLPTYSAMLEVRKILTGKSIQ